MVINSNSITTAIAWCLAWGEGSQPQSDLTVLQQMRQALNNGGEVPEEVRTLVEEAKRLETLSFPETLDELKQLTEEKHPTEKEKHPILWNSKIGLVYGGATKIKQYVFEEAKLPDIRGGSALLDRINLVDLPAFFNKKPESKHNYNAQCIKIRNWLTQNVSAEHKNILEALIPELIIYSTGGNILAFCPAAFVNVLANAIEKRYTHETLTANSCAVGYTFRLLETRFGLLPDNIEETFWIEKYRQKYKEPLVEAYYGIIKNESELLEHFKNRKSFNELSTKLAILFNQRRSGNDFENRPTRRYPPMFETHPYIKRDEGEQRSTITKANQLPGEPYFSETSARKRRVGGRAKTGLSVPPQWYKDIGLEWDSGIIEGWVDKFEEFLSENSEQRHKYCGSYQLDKVKIPQSLTEIGNVSNGFIAYIYADGNNIGGYIQKYILTAKDYQEFSYDVSLATEYAVYQALADNLHPRVLTNIKKSESTNKNGDLIHPFEILTIGGDDIILIVPADRALEIAKMIGEQFEQILLKQVSFVNIQGKNVEIKRDYRVKSSEKPIDLSKCHRYSWQNTEPSQCELSTSSGVLITAYNTPIYYAQKLFEQLLKSAKKRGKKLKNVGYSGGTVDFLTMKSVTMISSNIKEFREQALTKECGAKLRLYAAPYTLHELGGLLQVVQALKEVNFPKSQLYQIRSFLESGKRTAILNYLYFRSRLKSDKAELLKKQFEDAWCKAKTNEGKIAPWMYDSGKLDPHDTEAPAYETIWREIVDLYDFIQLSDAVPISSLEVDA
ncbi:type III-B CRISPR-associated protein Cas10/Cmr2 [Iningainema tapete]|uniref:Type III-B CRISPR-associated protein Cas10/Cmr2 n=1 Tax=Iningainema tapete BLCC-T55 TaxID=2748662 RepID=A0A8J7BYB0_9CYAN|nr:type III-B CRISPR-associated protein Cas10/Cmr2 [Iningainema tapete]MBD2775412.1 type III-B CRISPR-associated protein Cas10/Cmr2 [Iningainema tapete BLCC-T55]